ncbi:MAG: hypothetical protein ABWK01_05820, partial [Infirmifilum sp.]
VRRVGPPLVSELILDDFNKFERLVQSREFDFLVLSEGVVGLIGKTPEGVEQQALLTVRGVDPASFVEVAKTLMSAMRAYAPKSFTARVKLKKPLELTEEVKRKLSEYGARWR